MSDELIVDPAALATFATALETHAKAVNDVAVGLGSIGGAGGALFGNFDGADNLNQRAGQLLSEMVDRVTAVHLSLTNLQKVATEASKNYQASDHLSASSIASINGQLDAMEQTTANASGAQL